MAPLPRPPQPIRPRRRVSPREAALPVEVKIMGAANAPLTTAVVEVFKNWRREVWFDSGEFILICPSCNNTGRLSQARAAGRERGGLPCVAEPVLPQLQHLQLA